MPEDQAESAAASVFFGLASGAVVVEQPAGWPVLVLLRVATARAVERGDVLQRHEDVPVDQIVAVLTKNADNAAKVLRAAVASLPKSRAPRPSTWRG